MTIILRVLGGLALASVGFYFVALGLTFAPGGEEWAERFRPLSPFVMYVPFMLLLVYLWARVQLGPWLLRRGELDEAQAYATQGVRYSFWLRSKREVLINRIVLGRVHMVRGELDAARAALFPENLGQLVRARGVAGEALSLARWQAEVLLRSNDLAGARAVIQGAPKVERPKEERAGLLSAHAELALRCGELEQARELAERARWTAPESWAPWLALALVDHGRGVITEKSLKRLVRSLEPVAHHLPGRLGELELVHAEMLEELGRSEEAAEARARALAEVDSGRADVRSALLVHQRLGAVREDEEE
ncbi:MAG: hypothetical protein AAGI01_00165 [Myxococcota bacterium]